MHKISIIIPVYNAERTIGKCIDSIVQQTFQDFELILVNDGSKDRSLEICRDFEKIDKRITVTDQKNCGVSSARNRGLTIAKGEWITFVDSDDFVENKYLESFSKHISNTNKTLIVQGYTSIIQGKRGEIVIYNEELLKGKEFGKILEIHGGVWGKLFNTNILNKYNIKFDKELSYSEDTIFLLEYVMHCEEIKMIKDTAYNYVISDNGLSSRFNCFDSEFKLFHKFHELSTMLSEKYSFKLSGKIKRDYAIILMRSIYSLYIRKDRSRKQRVEILHGIKHKYYSLIKEYYTPQIKLMRLFKTVFLYDIRLFDLICCLKYKNQVQHA